MSYLETPSLRLVYFDPSLAYLAPYAARCFEGSFAFQQRIFGFQPSEPVTMLLKDFADAGNAAAGAVPRNQLQFDVAPMDFAFESFVSPERIYMLTNHELVHVVTMDQPAPSDRLFRRLFLGKVRPISEHPETILYHYLTTPRTAVPRWYNEGFAVFSETWMAGGVGRAQGAYDEMVFRSMVRDGSHFYDPLGLVSEAVKTSFQVGANAYLYGTRFFSYLALTRSPEKLVEWVVRGAGSRRYYASQFEQVFGLPLDRAWQEWIEFERRFQGENLERIREHPVTPYEDLSARALGSVSRAYLDSRRGVIYAAFNYPGVVAHLGAISLADGTVERLLEVKRPSGYGVTSLAFDPENGKLFYTTDQRALRDLRELDLETGRARTLLEDARVGDLVYDATRQSLWGLRHLNGIVTLVRIPAPYDRWVQVRSWPYGEVAYDLDVSPDGALLSASVAGIDGRFRLRVWSAEELIADGAAPPRHEAGFGAAVPLSFVFGADGRHLVGSAYVTGVANIWRWPLAEGGGTASVEDLEILTNAETGFFRPMPTGEEGEMLVFRYSGEGFVPARLEGLEPLTDVAAIRFLGRETIRAHPSLAEWQVGSPSRVPLDERIVDEGPYTSRRTFRVESAYPVVEGYKESVAYGYRINLSDDFALLEASAVASYSPDERLGSDERIHLRIDLRRRGWRASGTLNRADFYDLFGPTRTSRKGFSLGVGYDRLLIWDEPRELEASVDLTYWGDLETLPDFQNVASLADELWLLDAGLRYSNVRSSLGAVDDEKGHRWEVGLGASRSEGETVPRLRAGWDGGLPVPGGRNSSLWLRLDAGGAVGEIADPFAQVFFGGFGNNRVDHREVRRYREHYAFPGLDLNEVGGRTWGRALAEWNLPPVRFRRAGSTAFYLTWARASLFAAGLVANPEVDAARRELGSFGGQVDLRFTLLSNLEMTLSIGWARAVEAGAPAKEEFMASLRIL